MERWRERCINDPVRASMVLKEHGIAKRYFDADLSQFPTVSDIFAQDKSYYIQGPTGSGKTHLLAAMLKERVLSRFDRKYSALFITADDLLENIKAGFSTKRKHKEDEEEEEAKVDSVVSYYKDIEILAIDDLGEERITDWTLTTLAGIINHRYNEMMVTYITSNLDLDQLALQFNRRIASRLYQMCDVIVLNSGDRRVE